MKKPNLIPKTKKAVVITVAVVAGLVVGGAGVTRSEAAMSWLGIEQKLEHIDERNDNQDDRITNTEKDVEKLQKDTSTQPSTEKVVVREVVTENPTLTQEPQESVEPSKPEPVTITKAQKVSVSDSRTDCKYTYSDSTTKTFKLWSTGTSAEGHKTEFNSALSCDTTVVGQPKS